MKFLDSEGLAYLWLRIRNGFAAVGHRHTAEEVGALPASGGTVGGALTVSGALSVSGALTASGGVKGNVTGSATSCTGNAATATKLASARKINGVEFDGTRDVTVADGTKLPLSGGTLSGDVTLSGAARILKYNSGVRTGSVILMYKGDQNGSGLVIGDGGRTILGGGEAAQNLRAALGTAATDESKEELHLANDGPVCIHTNCQTIASRKTFTFDNSGALTAPGGFKGALTGNVTGSATSCTGNAATATKLASARKINEVDFDGTQDIEIPTGAKFTLVWENANPSATFPDQDISIPSMAASAKAQLLLIVFHAYGNYAPVFASLIGFDATLYAPANMSSGYSTWFCKRDVRFDRSNKKLQFDKGYTCYSNSDSKAEDNLRAMPRYIYAIDI